MSATVNAMPDEDLLTPREVADLLGVSVKTVETWRKQNAGPPWFQMSERVIRYRRGDVTEWLAAQRKDPGATT